MGFLGKAFGTVTITSFVGNNLKNALKDTEFGKTVFGFTDNIKDAAAEKFNEVVDGALSSYVSHIEADKWDNMIDNCSFPERDEYEEKRKGTRLPPYETTFEGQYYESISEDFMNVLSPDGKNDEKYAKMRESIEKDPSAWGHYLAQKGLNDEKLLEMQKEDISGYNLIKLSLGMQVSENQGEQTPAEVTKIDKQLAEMDCSENEEQSDDYELEK